MKTIPQEVKDIIASKDLEGANAPAGKVIVHNSTTSMEIPISRFNMSGHEDKLAQCCTITIANVNPNDPRDVGYYSPDRGDDYSSKKNQWYHQLLPGTEIQVCLGYGVYMAPVFTGLIDECKISTNPPSEYTITLSCRDYGKLLMENNINDYTTNKYLSYSGEDAADVAKDLCLKAGIPSEKLKYVGKSGIIIDFVDFQNTTFGNALSKVQDIACFDCYFDEEGYLRFAVQTDRSPMITGQDIVLNSTTTAQLPCYPISAGSEKVYNGDTAYDRGVDYIIDYKKGTLARTKTSTIPDGGTAYINYVYAAFVFKEGETLLGINYSIDSRLMSGQIIVEAGDCTGTATLPNPEMYGITADKTYTASKPELLGQDKANAYAEALLARTTAGYRQIEVAAIAIPWVQVGDCIQVIETNSTASEVYKIVSASYAFSPNYFVASYTCYYFGYTDF